MNSQYLEYISYFFAALSFTGAVFNSTLSIWGFYIWLVSNTFHALFNWHFEHWGYVILDLGFIATNIYGIYQHRIKQRNIATDEAIKKRGRPKKLQQVPTL